MITPLYIFDLDGTLALVDHRKHLLRDREDPECWRQFFAACINDGPNMPVIRTMERLRASGADILVFSGRSDEVRSLTLDWLETYTVVFSRMALHQLLTMRPAASRTPDDELKLMWYNALPEYDRNRLVAVFDDRDSVVAMWRKLGVTCFQVAPGEF